MGRTALVRLGWIVGLFALLVVAQWQGWVDLPTWLFWLLGIPVALLLLLVVAAFVLHRVVTRRFRRIFEQTAQQLQAWKEQGGRPAGDVVEGEVVDDGDMDPGSGSRRTGGATFGGAPDEDEAIRIPVEDGDE